MSPRNLSTLEQIKARNAKSDWATPKLLKFAGSEGENEGNLGFCKTPIIRKIPIIRTLIQKIEPSDDDFDEN